MLIMKLLNNSFNFGLVAMLTSCASGICVAYATNSPLLTAACSLAFISVQYSISAAACWIVARLSPPPEEAACMDHYKVCMPEPRRQSRNCTTTAAGYALPQILGFMALVAGAVLFVPCLYAIFITVMGAQEPRW